MPSEQPEMRLMQLHHVDANGKHDVVAQGEFCDYPSFFAWAEDVRKRHPEPDDSHWCACDEMSKHFVFAAACGHAV